MHGRGEGRNDFEEKEVHCITEENDGTFRTLHVKSVCPLVVEREKRHAGSGRVCIQVCCCVNDPRVIPHSPLCVCMQQHENFDSFHKQVCFLLSSRSRYVHESVTCSDVNLID